MSSLLSTLARVLVRWLSRLDPSLRGVALFPPGHFYSPLPEVRAVSLDGLPFDGAEYWENIDLQPAKMRAYYEELLAEPRLALSPGARYTPANEYFLFADAFTLAAILRREKPRRVIEVGSGYSTAVMVDTILQAGLGTEILCIEPHPERLLATVRPAEVPFVSIRRERVQEIPPGLFAELQPGDILFIDSSHVAKVGSDLTYLLLRVLPRLQPGVLVHFHDIFYPHSYPVAWLRAGRAWNETLILRALLANGLAAEVLAFNACAGAIFPELFREHAPDFLADTGGSLWLRLRSPA